VSVFPLGGGPWEAVSQGLTWPLDGLPWNRGSAGVSNRAPGGGFTVTSLQGRFLVVMPLAKGGGWRGRGGVGRATVFTLLM